FTYITPMENKIDRLMHKEHIQRSHFETLLEYNFNELKKGLFCVDCASLLGVTATRGKIRCGKCSKFESTGSSILRATIEFNILFPNEKITTHKIYEWCGGVVSRKVVRSVLNKY